MIKPINVSNKNEKINAILSKDKNYISVEFVDIDTEDILGCKNFIIQINNNEYIYNNERINIRGINNFAIIGKNFENNDYFVLSVLGKDIQGIITVENEPYSIL